MKNILKENIKNELRGLITESRADKLALRFLKSKGVNDYNEQMNIIGALKHDIPNLRLDKGKYMLAALRMYYDEHSLNDEQSIRALDNALKYIHAGNHQNEYDENLNGLTLDEISNTFREISRQMSVNDRERSAQRQFTGNSQYKIIPINSYEEAQPYGKYTSWCVTHGKNAFNNYTQGGNRFYFCFKNGFQNIPEQAGDNAPLDEYGLSMIAVNVDMNGDLTRITTRWNHDYNGENNPELETTEQLENIIGVRFYDVFKPYTREELHSMGIIPFDEVPELLAQGKKPEEIFTDISDFDEGFAEVELNGKYNFINTNGELLSPNQWFDYVRDFDDNGLAKVVLNDKYNFITTNGELLSPNQWFDGAWCFYGGFAWVKLNDKWNFINTNGEIVFPNQWFDGAGKFNEGFAMVQLNNKWNYINTNGEILSPNQWFDNVEDFKNGFARVVFNYKWNYINTNGEILSPNQWFDGAGYFYGGFACVQLNNKYNWINTNGELFDYETKQPIDRLNENKTKHKKIHINEEQIRYITESVKHSKVEWLLDEIESNANPLYKIQWMNSTGSLMKQMVENAYDASVTNFKDNITSFPIDVVKNKLAKLIAICQKKEEPIKDELEKLCVDVTSSLFKIDERGREINVSTELIPEISDEIDFHIEYDGLDYQYNNYQEIDDINSLIERRTINDALVIGGALEIYDLIEPRIVKQLFELDEDLPHLYSKIIKISNYLLFAENIYISDKEKHQSAYVNIEISGDEDKQDNIIVKGILFPFLLTETIRGYLEYIQNMSMNIEPKTVRYVIDKVDVLKDEPWYMRLGPVIWKQIFSDCEPEYFQALYEELFTIENNDFEKIMREIILGTKEGEAIKDRLLNNVVYNAGYQEFEKELNKKREEKSLLIDDVFTEDEM